MVWPINMLLLGLGAIAVNRDKGTFRRGVFLVLFVGIMIVPFVNSYVFGTRTIGLLGLSVYILFYLQLFIEVLRQVTRTDEVTVRVILGAVCGYLILIVIAVFAFLLLDYWIPNSFNNLAGGSVPDKYIQVSYFSMITLSTIGYGDITPANDSARLLAAFFGITGQFYMVALVGILISKFTSRNPKP